MKKIAKGTEQLAADGNWYRWKGAVWARVTKTGKTGVIAPKAIQYELSKKATGEKILPGKSAPKHAMKWFMNTIDDEMKHPKKVSFPKHGSMVTFLYDAKHQDTLPYWDKHPLSIIIGIDNDSLLGLNVHYLPPMIRARFFDGLMKFTGRNDIADVTDDDKFNVNWQAVARIPYVKKTIHRYLFSHIKSQLMEIYPSEWENTLFLPTANFVGASAKEIWRA
jgi:hypothetical protein